MRKLAIVMASVILLLTLAGCGAFSYNIRNYVDIPAYDSISIKRSDIDSQIKSQIESTTSYFMSTTKDLEDGTIEDGDTAYIYYKGTLVLFDGLFPITVGQDSIKGLDAAMKDKEFADGKLTFDMTLPTDFTFPDEIGAALLAKSVKAENATTEDPASAEKSTTPAEQPTATPAEGTVTPAASTETPAAGTETPAPDAYNPSVIAPVFYEDEDGEGELNGEPDGDAEVPADGADVPEVGDVPADGADASADASADDATTEITDPYAAYNTYFAGKTVTVELTVEGKSGKAEDGETLPATLRLTHVFDGGTYNADNETDKSETDKKGYKLTIGSNFFITGFETGMIGMSVKKGTTKSLNLNFPIPYSTNTVLSGLDVIFDVEIQSVSRPYTRDLNNDADFAEMRDQINELYGSEVLTYKTKAEWEDALRPEVIKALAANELVKKSKVTDWKYGDLEDYRSKAVNWYAYQYYQKNYSYPTSEAAIASAFFDDDTEAYEQGIANKAGQLLKYDWVLYQVAKDNDRDSVSGDEYDAYIAEQIEGTTTTEDTYVENAGGKSEVKKAIIIEKAETWLGEHVKIDENA